MIARTQSEPTTGSDAEFVPSPCVRVCTLDVATDVCIGCCRTREEIASWSELSTDERRRLLALVAERTAAASKTGSR